MTYNNMHVADGTAAGLAYDTLVRGGLSLAERRHLRADLLAYCKQDSLAMVRLLDHLKLHVP